MENKLSELERRIEQLEQRRIRQQDVLPGAIGVRQLGDIVQSVDTSTATAALGNGDQAVITHTLTQNQGAKMLAEIDYSMYVGSVAAANQLPGGSGVDESNYQVIGPWLDWGGTDNENVVLKCYVRNISAGSVSILFRLADRFISNFAQSETGNA